MISWLHTQCQRVFICRGMISVPWRSVTILARPVQNDICEASNILKDRNEGFHNNIYRSATLLAKFWLSVCQCLFVSCKLAGKAMAILILSYDPVRLALPMTETMEHDCKYIKSPKTLSPPLLCPSGSFRPSHLARSCWACTPVPRKRVNCSIA